MLWANKSCCFHMFGPCRRMSLCLYVCVFVFSLWEHLKASFFRKPPQKARGTVFHIHRATSPTPLRAQGELPSALPTGKSNFSDPNGPDPFLSPWPSSPPRSLVDGSLLTPANPAGQLMGRVAMDTVIKVWVLLSRSPKWQKMVPSL